MKASTIMIHFGDVGATITLKGDEASAAFKSIVLGSDKSDPSDKSDSATQPKAAIGFKKEQA